METYCLGDPIEGHADNVCRQNQYAMPQKNRNVQSIPYHYTTLYVVKSVLNHVKAV